LDPLWLAYQCARRRVDLLFSPGFNAAAGRTRQLLVVHDLIHLLYPAESSGVKQLYYEQLVRPAIRRTGAVATVSEFSRKAIVEWSGLDPDRVLVAPGALSAAFLDPKPGADTRGPEDEPAPYVLYVGNGKPHKNVPLLLDALGRLPDLRLVCVGLRPSDVVGTKLPASRITLLRGVADGDLARLYSRAQCLAFPSQYEGFGLPALEALSQGTPVAYLSDAVGETVGDGCGVRSGDNGPDAFARCIEGAIALRGDPRFAAAARRQARRYDWDTSADRIGRELKRLST
jgi:glycosyltransferase involved in cell wall biosynthesis